jgi:hypothetical protein
MSERLKPGHYRIGRIEDTHHRDPPKEVGVIKGEVANETSRAGFNRIMGLSKSKWYVYEFMEHRRQYHDNTGTGVLDVASLEFECSSKSEAVEKAKRRYNL